MSSGAGGAPSSSSAKTTVDRGVDGAGDGRVSAAAADSVGATARTPYQQVRATVTAVLVETFSEVFSAADDPMVTSASRAEFGDYQCNAAMRLGKALQQKPRDVAQRLREALEPRLAGVCQVPLEVAGPGFINFRLTDEFVTATLSRMLRDPRGKLGVPAPAVKQRVVHHHRGHAVPRAGVSGPPGGAAEPCGRLGHPIRHADRVHEGERPASAAAGAGAGAGRPGGVLQTRQAAFRRGPRLSGGCARAASRVRSGVSAVGRAYRGARRVVLQPVPVGDRQQAAAADRAQARRRVHVRDHRLGGDTLSGAGGRCAARAIRDRRRTGDAFRAGVSGGAPRRPVRPGAGVAGARAVRAGAGRGRQKVQDALRGHGTADGSVGAGGGVGAGGSGGAHRRAAGSAGGRGVYPTGGDGDRGGRGELREDAVAERQHRAVHDVRVFAGERHRPQGGRAAGGGGRGDERADAAVCVVIGAADGVAGGGGAGAGAAFDALRGRVAAAGERPDAAPAVRVSVRAVAALQPILRTVPGGGGRGRRRARAAVAAGAVCADRRGGAARAGLVGHPGAAADING
eukprot:ctg_1521.g497